MLIIGLIGWRHIALSAANQDMSDKTDITELRLKSLVEPATTAIRIIGELSLSGKNLGPDYKYLPVMLQELKTNNIVSGVYIGFKNGNFIAVRSLSDQQYRSNLQAPDNADYVLQIIQNNTAGKATHYFDFYSYEGKLIETRPVPDFALNPLDRPWYKSAQNSPGLSISSPYVFFSTNQVGLTVSKKSLNNKAVIGMDIALKDLGSILEYIKITPNTQIAITSTNGNLVGYQNLGKLLVTDHGTVELPDIAVLGDSPLVQAYRQSPGQPVQLQAAGLQWLGITTAVGQGLPMQLVMAIPMQELLSNAYSYIRLMLVLAILIIIIMFAWSWWSGGRLSRLLEQLVTQAKAISRFNFTKTSDQNIPIREIKDLQLSANNVSKTIDSLLSISKLIGTESDTDTMLQKVLVLTINATHCISGAVYLWDAEQNKMSKSAEYGSYNYPELFIDGLDNANDQNAVDSGNLQSKFKLNNRNQELQGILILETDHTRQELYGEDFNAFVNRLTGMLEVAIETRQLIQAQKDLFYGMVHMLADAIDAKSPYTGGHCKRVPQLAIMMIDNMQSCTSGKFADFNLTDQELKEFSLAAWLHDCGKLVIPQDIVDKASKLEMIYNRIHEIRMRFEVLLRDAEIKYLKQKGNNQQALKEYEQTKTKLIADYEFVASCNIGGEYLDDASIERLQQIGTIEWTRNLDDLSGLPEVELKQRLKGRTDKQNKLPVTEKLLSDQPFNQVDWDSNDLIAQLNHDYPGIGLDMYQPALKQNTGELHNLTIRRGTLTEEDRFIIQNHMVQTLLMLHKLPWPSGFKNVPDIASNHHERLDGQGYPRRLKAGTLPISHRVLAIADVFEALTANDRPYKQTKTISESLQIMARMCLEHHLDQELFIYFLENKIWLEYGEKFLHPQQIDAVDIDHIKKLITG